MIVPFGHVLLLAALLFLMGLSCTIARRNLVMILIGVEIMLNASGLALVASSLRWMSMDGQAFTALIIGMAASEVTVGLALVVAVRRASGSLDADRQTALKEDDR
jgi:NADH-quinone oxidoreductase subunit K